MAKRIPDARALRAAYHHGDLRGALVDATEALLAERGIEGFSLREVARRSGVSPAAPAHHFGDSDGLLAEVARIAFDGLAAALEAGNVRGGTDPVARLREQGIGYVGFALRYPGRFGLMFREGLRKDESLIGSAEAAFAVLERGVRDLYGMSPDAVLAPAQWQALLGIWSTVHGFAHLASAGRLDRFASDNRASLLRTVLPGLLQQQLQGLQAQAGAAASVSAGGSAGDAPEKRKRADSRQGKVGRRQRAKQHPRSMPFIRPRDRSET
jgi:AcrR family transcriptional regulator